MEHNFPFTIRDVAALLNLKIRRSNTQGAYTDCPFCGDKRGKMYLNYQSDVWRCNYCDKGGGMLSLYACVHGVSTTNALKEINEALHTGETNKCTQARIEKSASPVAELLRAPADEIHKTFTQLLKMLTLSEKHRQDLRERGLSDEQICSLGYKSTPPPFLCRAYTEKLISQGCKVDGIPGFYIGDDQNWTVRFSKRTAGIIIPIKGINGFILGAQIRLDVPIKDKDDPPDKEGTKYIWLSSANKNKGITSGAPLHFVGNSHAKTVYVTEGGLKADISHLILERTFAAVAGANNTTQLDALFAILVKNGTELIVEAYDIDKYRNKHVANGASKMFTLARSYGMNYKRLIWNPNFKGVDNWAVARKIKKSQLKEDRKANEFGADLHLIPFGKKYQFRIYQLAFTQEKPTIPYAFSGISALHKLGFEHPPAADYCQAEESVLFDTDNLSDREILSLIFERYNNHLPDGYGGRNIATSDVVELYSDTERSYFYRDVDNFIEVSFSPRFTQKLGLQAAA